jgi:hypothetical protein
MDLGAILLGLSILILAGAFVLRPLREPSGIGPSVDGRRLSELQAERDRILDALREVDLDSTMGKLLPEDYRVQREALTARGAAVLRQIDEAGGAAGPRQIDEAGGSAWEPSRSGLIMAPESKVKAARLGTAAEAEAELEAAVLRLRTRPPASQAGGQFCSRCGSGLHAGDRFCANCGAPVPDTP